MCVVVWWCGLRVLYAMRPAPSPARLRTRGGASPGVPGRWIGRWIGRWTGRSPNSCWGGSRPRPAPGLGRPALRPGAGRERITMGLRAGLLTGLHRRGCGTESVVPPVPSVPVSSVVPSVVLVPMVIELTTTPPAMHRQAQRMWGRYVGRARRQHKQRQELEQKQQQQATAAAAAAARLWTGAQATRECTGAGRAAGTRWAPPAGPATGPAGPDATGPAAQPLWC